VVLQLPFRGLAEAGVPDTLRVSTSHNVFDDSTLARGVHALQYEQYRACVARPTVGVQHLLQFGESDVAFVLKCRGVGLGATEARSGFGVDVADLLAETELQLGVRFVRPQRRQI
jgi:hypothetical protein